MNDILHKLFEYTTLSQEESKEILLKITDNQYDALQVTSFLTVFMMRPITVEELTGFRQALLERCKRIHFEFDTIDVCGTGGDGKDTFNISTLAGFIVAGTGIKVTKHSNIGVSSISGSSNVMKQLGYTFTHDKSILQNQLEKAGICFLHAPLFHPAMASVIEIRKRLALRTFFNMLGPLVNPSFPKYQLTGVFDPELARKYHYIFQKTPTKYRIVHSLDGYDEISLTDEVKIISKSHDQILSPEDLGFQKLNANELKGGKTMEESAKIFLSILEGNGTEAQNQVVLSNAAEAILCVKTNYNRKDAIQMAKESLFSGKAKEVLNRLIQLS